MKYSRPVRSPQKSARRSAKPHLTPLLRPPAIPSYLNGRIAEAKESKECVE